MRIRRRSDYQTKRWKNGRGSTLEIAREGEGEEFTWRLSMADLTESGPFSAFPGMERWLVLLEGTQIKLFHPELNKEKTLSLFEPYRFSGDGTTHALVHEKGRDFNLIYRRDLFEAEVSVESYAESHEAVVHHEGLSALFCLRGALRTPVGVVGVYETLLLEGERAEVRPSAQTSLLVIKLRRLVHRNT